MFEQDYILRMLQQFFNCVYEWLHTPIEKREKLVDFTEKVYYTFFEEQGSFFEKMTFDKTVRYIQTKYRKSEWTPRMEVIVELSYLSLDDRHNDKKYLQRLQQMFMYINENSNTFSFERNNKMEIVQNLLCVK